MQAINSTAPALDAVQPPHSGLQQLNHHGGTPQEKLTELVGLKRQEDTRLLGEHARGSHAIREHRVLTEQGARLGKADQLGRFAQPDVERPQRDDIHARRSVAFLEDDPAGLEDVDLRRVSETLQVGVSGRGEDAAFLQRIQFVGLFHGESPRVGATHNQQPSRSPVRAPGSTHVWEPTANTRRCVVLIPNSKVASLLRLDGGCCALPMTVD